MQTFESAAFTFCADVLLAMRKKIEDIHSQGWPRTDSEIDVNVLLAEHMQGQELFKHARIQVSETDRNEFEAKFGEPLV